jgi:hypothetical protein
MAGNTPFPEEEEASQDHTFEPVWDPWKGPPKPTAFAGLAEDYFGLAGMGRGMANLELTVSGLARSHFGRLAEDTPNPVNGAFYSLLERGAELGQQDARERVHAMTPDPATTGWATRLLHGFAEVGTLVAAGGATGGGPLAAAGVAGGAESGGRYSELREAGVTPGTAAASAGVTGVTTAAGVLMPAAFGSSLLTRLLTGAGANVGLGGVSRFADHTILEHAGYHDMAEQEKVWDATQVLIDAALGLGFGGLHHALAPRLNVPETEDAAHTANLALRDRRAAPGVAVDPAAANAHQAALEKALTDLTRGQHVDVADTGVDQATFARRPEIDPREAAQLIHDVIASSGLLEEHAKLDLLEAELRLRMPNMPGGEVRPLIESEHLARLSDDQAGVLNARYAEAAEAKPNFDHALRGIAEEVGGRPEIRPLKDSGRAVDKILSDYDGDASRVKDILRGTIQVPDAASMARVAEVIRDRFSIESEKNRAVSPGPDGYRDIMFKVHTPNGHVAEIQVHLPAMVEAKHGIAHDLYQERERITRGAESEGRLLTAAESARRDELNAQMKAIYDRAWNDSTSASHSAGEIAAPLRSIDVNGNLRGPEGLSNANASRPPPATGTSATGTPSTSQSRLPDGSVADIPTLRAASDIEAPPTRIIRPGEGGRTADITDSIARQALLARPDLEIPHPYTGETVRAADMLREVNAVARGTEKTAPTLMQALAECAARNPSMSVLHQASPAAARGIIARGAFGRVTDFLEEHPAAGIAAFHVPIAAYALLKALFEHAADE